MSKLKEQVGDAWYSILEPIVKTDDFKEKYKALGERRKQVKVYPEKDKVFRCFEETPLEELKVILIGQDPYHDGKATGLCFDTNGKFTPSMNQIYTGYTEEYPQNFNTNMLDGKLEHWAKQGILMLNTALTVEKGNAGSHIKVWEKFIDELFVKLDNFDRPLCFIAWGAKAQKFAEKIQNPKHCIITAKHPASAAYSKDTWNSEGTFKKVEKWIKENYNQDLIW